MSGFELVVFIVILVAVALAAVAWFTRSMRKMMRVTTGAPPFRVNPELEPSPRWRHAAEIEQLTEEYRTLGFQEIGAYKVPEVEEGLQILAFLHPDERLYGVIYDHPGIEPGFDMHCAFEDGTSLTAISSAIGEEAKERPGHRTIGLEVERVGDLFEALQSEAPPVPRKRVSDVDFVPFFKREYAKAMNWRLMQSHVSREDIRRQAEENGRTMTHEEVEETYKSFREPYLGEVGAACLAQFMEEKGIPAEEWEKRGPDLFAVPEILDPHELADVLDAAVGLDENQREQLERASTAAGETAGDRLRRFLNQEAVSVGLEEVGDVHEPIPAVIVAVREKK